MKKYFLTSLIVLTTYNSYGAFDFTNYTPTLNSGNNAYTISFTSVANDTAPNTITTYLVDYDNYSTTPIYYTYSTTHGAATNTQIVVDSNDTDITDAFIGNIYNNSAAMQGSAIYNDNLAINYVTGNFIENSNWTSGGAIYNRNGTINSITGDFIENHALNSNGTSGSYNTSGAINNNHGNIGSITGNFIGNTSTSYAGAIHNNNNGVIGSISGDFIGNITKNASGGAIYNINATINSITGNFINNKMIDGREGAAIYNDGTIGTIHADFIGNTARLYGGAIYNSGIINSITGDFIGNSVQRIGSAIVNEGTIGYISGNFIGNHTNDAVGGAIYTTQDIKFLSENDSYIISGNYGDGQNLGMLSEIDDDDDINVTFENKQNTSYTINDEIAGWNQDSYTISVTGDGTGYTMFNNNIGNVSNINITNGNIVFGQTPNYYTGTASIGHFESTPTINLQNGIFDIANGYTENITLNGINSVGNNNFLRIDLDIDNNNADFINITGDISGQINLVVASLSDLDINDNIIWFADISSNDMYLFNLYSVSGIDYELGLYFDSDDNKYGLVKKENSNIPKLHPTLPAQVAQTANYLSRTVVHTVKKLTNSMQRRVGELQWSLHNLEQESNSDDKSNLNDALWVRNIYKNFDTNHTSVGLSGMEFGYDRIVSSTDNYKWYIGGLGYISGGDSKFNSIVTDIDGYGLGAYVMLLEKSGWFSDLVFRQHFINIENAGIESDYTASSFNLEIGKEFIFDDNADEIKWFVKPSLEGTYIIISGTNMGDYKIKDSTTQTLSLSVLGGPRWNFEDSRKFQIYGKIGYNIDNSDAPDVIVDGIQATQDIATNTMETGIGIDFCGTDKSTNIYFEASYIFGSDYSETSGNLGLRYTF